MHGFHPIIILLRRAHTTPLCIPSKSHPRPVPGPTALLAPLPQLPHAVMQSFNGTATGRPGLPLHMDMQPSLEPLRLQLRVAPPFAPGIDPSQVGYPVAASGVAVVDPSRRGGSDPAQAVSAGVGGARPAGAPAAAQPSPSASGGANMSSGVATAAQVAPNATPMTLAEAKGYLAPTRHFVAPADAAPNEVRCIYCGQAKTAKRTGRKNLMRHIASCSRVPAAVRATMDRAAVRRYELEKLCPPKSKQGTYLDFRVHGFHRSQCNRCDRHIKGDREHLRRHKKVCPVLVQEAGGSAKVTRTRFSEEVVTALSDVFSVNQTPSAETVSRLAAQFGETSSRVRGVGYGVRAVSFKHHLTVRCCCTDSQMVCGVGVAHLHTPRAGQAYMLSWCGCVWLCVAFYALSGSIPVDQKPSRSSIGRSSRSSNTPSKSPRSTGYRLLMLLTAWPLCMGVAVTSPASQVLAPRCCWRMACRPCRPSRATTRVPWSR